MTEPKAVPPEKPERKNGEPAGRGSSNNITLCDLCGAEMYEWHCRIVCQSCGYQRDCSDP